MKLSKISIVIPIYNCEDFLSDCLASLISQSYANIEIILINDGSVDNSSKIAEDFALRDSRIKIFNQRNLGASAARNSGLSKARGEYIIFMDADDYLLHNRALEKIQSIATKEYDAIMYNITYESKGVIYPLKEGAYSTKENLGDFLFEMIKEEHLNSPCNKLYSKQILDVHNVRFNENIKIGEDLLFNIEYFKHCKSVYYLNANLYFYRTSNAFSATSTYKKNKYLDLMFVNDTLTHWSTANAKLLGISKYIRIKNILSCLRDVANGYLDGTTAKEEVRRLKKSNQRIIIRNCGIRLYLISLVYTYIDMRLIYLIITKLYRKRKEEKA